MLPVLTVFNYVGIAPFDSQYRPNGVLLIDFITCTDRFLPSLNGIKFVADVD